MKVAIMQPYVFPYIGYFQLIHAVDAFVFYDDVNFIKQGWINRNNLLVNSQPYLFTVPVEQISSFVEIQNVRLHQRNFELWQRKILKTLGQSYRKAPFFEEAYPLIVEVLANKHEYICGLAMNSIEVILKYLDLKRNIYVSSVSFANTKGFDRAERLIEIVKHLKGDHYINPIGGVELYTKEYFKQHGVYLNFLQSHTDIRYPQSNGKDFVSWLSIIDVLMYNSKEQVNELMKHYSLV